MFGMESTIFWEGASLFAKVWQTSLEVDLTCLNDREINNAIKTLSIPNIVKHSLHVWCCHQSLPALRSVQCRHSPRRSSYRAAHLSWIFNNLSAAAAPQTHSTNITPPAHLISHYFIQNAFIINHKECRSWCNAFRVSFGCHLTGHWMKWTGWSFDNTNCLSMVFSSAHFMMIVW